MKQKKYYQSYTLWINFIILVISLFDKEFFDTLGVSEHISNAILALSIKIIAIMNIALRLFFTNSEIKFKNETDN